MEDSLDAMNGGWTVPYDGDIPPGFEDIAMVPSEPVEPMTGPAATDPTWGVRPMQPPGARSLPQSYSWPAGTDAVYREMRLGTEPAPTEAPPNLLPLVLLALGAGGIVGWQYLGPLGAAGGALLGASGVNAYRAFKNRQQNPQEALTSGTWAVAGAAAALYLLYRAGSSVGDEYEDEDDEYDDDGEDVPPAEARSIARRYQQEAPRLPRIVPGGYEPIDVEDEDFEDADEPAPRAPARPRRRYTRNATAKPRRAPVRATPNASQAIVQMKTPTPVEPDAQEDIAP